MLKLMFTNLIALLTISCSNLNSNPELSNNKQVRRVEIIHHEYNNFTLYKICVDGVEYLITDEGAIIKHEPKTN